jgi:hypothetical protein
MSLGDEVSLDMVRSVLAPYVGMVPEQRTSGGLCT